jgi:hypothetical protein
MNKEYWVIYIIDFSGPISSGRFGRDDIEFRVLKIVEGTPKEAEEVALSYMTQKTFGRTIMWQKVEDGLTRC